MASSALRLEPPATDQALDTATGLHSPAWTEHNQKVTDRLAEIPVELTTGVTDGSDAAAGKIGEYLTASFSGVAAVSNASLDVGSMPLPAGDWELSGAVRFISSGANVNAIQAWVNTVSASPPTMIGRSSVILQTGTMMSGTALATGGLRVSQAAAGTAYLSAAATFPSGTVTALGAIQARRVR